MSYAPAHRSVKRIGVSCTQPERLSFWRILRVRIGFEQCERVPWAHALTRSVSTPEQCPQHRRGFVSGGYWHQNYPADTTRVVDTRITRTDGYYTADEDTTLQPTRTLGHRSPHQS